MAALSHINICLSHADFLVNSPVDSSHGRGVLPLLSKADVPKQAEEATLY